ncbi:hypothetical protein [Pseudomonas fluorescens]|nr:hypothetical protein [Pseudomonas fluorescens]
MLSTFGDVQGLPMIPAHLQSLVKTPYHPVGRLYIIFCGLVDGAGFSY